MNDSFEAADILNEVFLDVWLKAGNYEGRSKVSTWLFSIAYYKTMDRLRKKKPELIGEDHLADIADNSPETISCMINAEGANDVRYCVKTLNIAHRTVMELAFFEEMSYREIAAIVDCPENTVKTRMFHAKQAMKRCLNRRMEKNDE